jgi:hypothetical protein
LTGKDNQGNPVNLTTPTDSNGAFSFNNLAAGTYEIVAPQVAGDSLVAELGTDNGKPDGSVDAAGDIVDIVLNEADHAINYDYANIQVIG